MVEEVVPPVRVRILVAATDQDAAWAAWQAARDSSSQARQLVLQRIQRETALRYTVGLGFGESLRWFGPVEDDRTRRWVIEYAEQVLLAGQFPPPAAELASLSWSPRPAETRAEVSAGIVVLSHADTDLLSIARARGDLPTGFPDVAAYSLAGFASSVALVGTFSQARAGRLVVLARIHGAATSVPGLSELLVEAEKAGWDLIVISAVGGDPAAQPRTTNISAAFATTLTEYFMAGGVRNVVECLRCIAHERLGFAATYEPPRPMPAHGLYHPDLLITDPQEWEHFRVPGLPVAVVLFYRAHVLSGNLRFVDETVRALESRGFAATGIFTSSLRDRDESGSPLALQLLAAPTVVVNTLSFPMLTLTSLEQPPSEARQSPFAALGAPLIQAICCGTSRAEWAESARGLSPVETAMNIALPECDGRVITVPISFKENHRYVPDTERLGRVADFARRLATLRTKANADKRIAIVLSNSGSKAQKIGGAVGLDTPASLVKWLSDLEVRGYEVGPLPESAHELMNALLARGCYDDKCPLDEQRAWRMPRARYVQWFRNQSATFRKTLREAWGEPDVSGPTMAPPFWRGGKQSARSTLLALHEPHTDRDDYLFSGVAFGNVLIAIQPPRGFGFDRETIYHSPDVPPCHHYAAFYRWLAEEWRADALIHFGTHGTLEWLPGKSVAPSADCAADALLGDLPLFYPFVINNPGEGAQAKRRTHAVIVDHLVPPLTQADTYGPLAALAHLVEEYYRAENMDPAKLPVLRSQIWDLVKRESLEEDLSQIRRERHADHVHSWDDRLTEQGVPRGLEGLSGRGFAHLLEDLDAYLCDLGRAQIRSGLHVFGVAPTGEALVDLMFAVLYSANGDVPSLLDGLTRALGISCDELRAAQGVWLEPVHATLGFGTGSRVTAGQIRKAIDRTARELLHELARGGFKLSAIAPLVQSRFGHEASDLARTLQFACEVLAPNIARTSDETHNLLDALDGRYVPPGPSGAPTRGMAHVLPTGRNFYTVDPRGLPTPAAWSTGLSLADQALKRYTSESGRWPESVALSVWGTPTMRTGGDEIAEALAFLGVRPVWEPVTRRTHGLEIIPLAELGRPRIDVVLRVSGFFRDAFPSLMQLFDAAVQRVALLNEAAEDNYVRKHWLHDIDGLLKAGVGQQEAQRRASYRVFSSKPGAYGTGLMEVIENRLWSGAGDLAATALEWGAWTLTADGSSAAGCGGIHAKAEFERRLAGVELVLQNQDNGEQDLFDSSDFFEFQGGVIAAVAALTGARPKAYVGYSADPAHPQTRTLQAEALRVFRSRVVNPKWLAGAQRHGFRGGLEMAATVDCLFGFAATAGVVTDWMFEAVAERFAAGAGRDFLQSHNPWALNSIAERLLEADHRKLWTAKPHTAESLRSVMLTSESVIEEHAEGYT